MNKTVSATGMTIKSTTSESLVISNSIPVGTKTSVALTSQDKTFLPATHAGDGFVWDSSTSKYIANTGTSNANLKYVLNTEKIDAYTGEEAGSPSTSELIYVDAVNGYIGKDAISSNPAPVYYVDYVVYVASSGNKMTSQDLVVEFDDDTKDLFNGKKLDRDTLNAASIDFYIEDVTAQNQSLTLTTFKGKLQGRDANDDTNGKVTLLSGGDIYANTDSTYVRVTMRVYLDGALNISDDCEYEVATVFDDTETYYEKTLDSTDHNAPEFEEAEIDEEDFKADGAVYYKAIDDSAKDYIYTDYVNIEDISLGVKFTTSDHAA